MALFRRGKIWWYKFKFARQPYRESTKSTSKTLAAEAERKRHRELEEAVNGLKRRVGPMLFSVASADWLETKRPAWAPNTYTAAALDVGHLKAHFGKLLLTDIKDRDISDYQRIRRGQKAAAKTINNEVGTLRAIMRRHRLWADLQPDVRMLQTAETGGRSLGVDEEEKLLKACAASRSRSLYTAAVVTIHTGLRNDELRLLTWRQMDLENGTLRVGKSKTAHGTGRVVPLNEVALKELQAWSAQFPKRKPAHYVCPSEKVGVAGNDRIVSVFDTDPEKAISSWKVAWTTARTESTVSVRWHDLRHTCCTRLLERGVSFPVVATIMGWSAGTTVRMAKRYGHIGESVAREALALLAAKPTDTTSTAATTATQEPSSPTLAPGPVRPQ